MKCKNIVLLVSVLSLFFVIPNCVKAITISENGTARAFIVIDKSASVPQQHAATELASFLQQVTGGTFEIRHDITPGKSNIIVGPTAGKLVDPNLSTEALGEEGIVIRTVGDNLILAGGEPRGTLYAVYTFLEDYVGCHWWTATESYIPKKVTLAVENMNYCYVPVLEYRETNAYNSSDPNFSVRNKYNGNCHRLFIDNGLSNVEQDMQRGGRKAAYIRDQKWSSHGMWTLIPPEMYFNDHPEWYTLIDGKRTASTPHYPQSSLCLTNEEMLKELIKNAKLALGWNPHATLISIAQTDDAGPPEHCQCYKCMAVEKEEESPSGVLIHFVNDVADGLEKDFPNVSVVTLAYHYTQKPPKYVKPHPGVIVQLSAIRCSYSVPFEDDINREFRDDIVGWSRICNRLYVWDYPGGNFSNPLVPHPNLRVLASNIRFLIANGTKGIFQEFPVTPGVEFAELRTWVLAKLAWNPSLDNQKLINEFVNGYYGPGGKDVLSYINFIHDAVGVTGEKLTIGASLDERKFLSFETLARSWQYLKNAESATKADPLFLRRVRDAQLPIMWVVMMRWDELQKEKESAKCDWPFSNSIADIMKEFIPIASAKGIVMDGMPMTPQMQEAMK